MHIRQPKIPALKAEGQASMVDAEAMQDSRLKIVDVNGVADNVVTVIVGFAPREARLDAAAGHPQRETAAVMIAAVVGCRQSALAIDGAAEFAAPNDERLVE